MKRVLKPALILAAALPMLGACSLSEPLTPAFGDAVRHNMAAHIVNPEGSAATGPVVGDGARAAAGIERYETGRVKPPRVVPTTVNTAAGKGN